mgnify:FL=1
MSLTVDGVWKAGIWATTVWASNVWFEQLVIDTHDGFDSEKDEHRRRRESRERLREQLRIAAFGPDPVREVAEEVQAVLVEREAKEPLRIDYQHIYRNLMT